jgi:DNA-binding CsgD family transcriptional regulator
LALEAIDDRPRLVVDRELNIVWQCANAARLLQEPMPIVVEGPGLVAGPSNRSNGLGQFIEQACEAPAKLLIRGQSKAHWALLTAWAASFDRELVCVLFTLSQPCRDVRQSGLAAALGLTNAEARVLDGIAGLKPPAVIADEHGVSLSTVRSHLKQIHAKAGVETSVQLVRLARAFAGS